MLNEDQRFIVRELKSYNYLHHKLADMTEQYVRSLNYLRDEIKRVDIELNEFHVPSISYDAVSINSVPSTKNTRVLELITNKDILEKKILEKESDQKKEVMKITQRIDDIDVLLNKLNTWERQYITHMYIECRCIEYMMDNYNFSRKSIFNKANRILNKMLK